MPTIRTIRVEDEEDVSGCKGESVDTITVPIV
jgi:hypothetical protein